MDKIGCSCGAVWSYDGKYTCGPIVGKVQDYPDVKIGLQKDCPSCWID